MVGLVASSVGPRYGRGSLKPNHSVPGSGHRASIGQGGTSGGGSLLEWDATWILLH
jgi:hypothetical protein